MTDDIQGWQKERADKEHAETKRQLAKAREEIAALEESLGIIRAIEHTLPDPPKWLAPAPSKKHRGTPVLLMADNHFDEVVNPEEIYGLNKYNRQIAEQHTNDTRRP